MELCDLCPCYTTENHGSPIILIPNWLWVCAWPYRSLSWWIGLPTWARIVVRVEKPWEIMDLCDLWPFGSTENQNLYLYKIESLNLTQLRDAIPAVRYIVEKKLIYPWIWWFMEMDLKCIWHTWSHYCSDYEVSTQRRFCWFVLFTPFAICRIFPWFMKYSFCLKVSFVFNTKNLYWGNI